MIIAKSASAGAAKIVPSARDIDTFADLQLFAHEVASAEGIRAGLSCAWGYVAVLMCRDESGVAQDWRGLRIDTASVLSTYAPGDAPTDDGGILDPALWSSAFDGFDVLIATVTKPVANYPSVTEIAAAMGAPPTGNKAHAYFRANRSAGITTFEDDAILAALGARGFAF